MHTFSENDMDRETLRHLSKMNSKPWYAIAVNIPDSGCRAKIQGDLDKLLSDRRFEETRSEQSLVYLVGQYTHKMVERILQYLGSQNGIVSKKVLRAEKYGLFAGNPNYWLRDYAGFSLK